MKFLSKIVAYFKAKKLASIYKRKLDSCAFTRRRAELADRMTGDISINDSNLFNKIDKKIESVFPQFLAELTWLDSIVFYSSGITPYSARLDFIINLDEAKLFIPTDLKIEDKIHLIFADKIFMGYADFRGNDYPYSKCIIRPESILPYPKKIIVNAGNHYLSCISSHKYNQYFDGVVATRDSDQIKDKRDLFNVAQALLFRLQEDFVPLSREEVPENFKDNYSFYFDYRKRLDESSNN